MHARLRGQFSPQQTLTMANEIKRRSEWAAVAAPEEQDGDKDRVERSGRDEGKKFHSRRRRCAKNVLWTSRELSAEERKKYIIFIFHLMCYIHSYFVRNHIYVDYDYIFINTKLQSNRILYSRRARHGREKNGLPVMVAPWRENFGTVADISRAACQPPALAWWLLQWQLDKSSLKLHNFPPNLIKLTSSAVSIAFSSKHWPCPPRMKVECAALLLAHFCRCSCRRWGTEKMIWFHLILYFIASRKISRNGVWARDGGELDKKQRTNASLQQVSIKVKVLRKLVGAVERAALHSDKSSPISTV